MPLCVIPARQQSRVPGIRGSLCVPMLSLRPHVSFLRGAAVQCLRPMSKDFWIPICAGMAPGASEEIGHTEGPSNSGFPLEREGHRSFGRQTPGFLCAAEVLRVELMSASVLAWSLLFWQEDVLAELASPSHRGHKFGRFSRVLIIKLQDSPTAPFRPSTYGAEIAEQIAAGCGPGLVIFLVDVGHAGMGVDGLKQPGQLLIVFPACDAH